MIAGLYFYDQLRPYMQETRLKIIMPMYGVWENISILGISLKLSLLTPYKWTLVNLCRPKSCMVKQYTVLRPTQTRFDSPTRREF
jgi:hypothetical protein